MSLLRDKGAREFLELPKDMEGVTCHFNDLMVTTRGITFSVFGWTYYEGKVVLLGWNTSFIYYPEDCVHLHFHEKED